MAEPELKGSPAELAAYLAGLSKQVSVTGEAEVKVPADRANVTLKVTTESKSLQEALRLNQEVRAKMLAALKERGIPADKVQSSRFSSTPKHWVFSDKAKSYRIENLVKVTVQDDKEFSAVAQLVDKFPELQFVTIDFEHSDKEGLKRKALAQALDNASERKRVFEERLGVKLQPKSFSQPRIIVQTPEREQAYRKSSAYGESVKVQSGSPPTTGAFEVAEEGASVFGELVLTALVTVDYAVEKQ
jgi:uncharacterized protein YggE